MDAPDASPLAALTGSQISQGFLGQPIQPTLLDILLQLPIPTGLISAAVTGQIFLPSGEPRGIRIAEITTRIPQVMTLGTQHG